MRRTAVLLLLLALAVTGCGGSSAVHWSDYPAGEKSTIDRAAAAKDCEALRGKFQTYWDSNDYYKRVAGHTTVDITDYITDELKSASCPGT